MSERDATWIPALLERLGLKRARILPARPFVETAWDDLDRCGLLDRLRQAKAKINTEAGWEVLEEEANMRPHRRPCRYTFAKERRNYILELEIGTSEIRACFYDRKVESKSKGWTQGYLYRYLMRRSKASHVVRVATGVHLLDLQVREWFTYLLTALARSARPRAFTDQQVVAA